MSVNSPNSSIVACGRVGAVGDAVRWVVQLAEQGFCSRFGWSIRGGVQSGKGGDGLKPLSLDRFPGHHGTQFPKKISGEPTRWLSLHCFNSKTCGDEEAHSDGTCARPGEVLRLVGR